MSRKFIGEISILTVIAVLMSYLSVYNFDFFHFLVEFLCAVAAFCIMIIAVNTSKVHKSSYFTFLGTAIGYIGIIELLRLMVYVSRCSNNGNTIVQLEIFSGLLLAVSFLLANTCFIRTNHVRLNSSISAFLVITVFFTVAILQGWVPTCFEHDRGLTIFARVSVYIIVLVTMIAIGILVKNRACFPSRIVALVGISLCMSCCSELKMLFYGLNLHAVILGYILKLGSFFFLYLVLVDATLRNPHKALYREILNVNYELERKIEVLEQQMCASGESNYSLSRLERLGLVGEMAAGIAHEIRNPLTTVRGFLQLYTTKHDLVNYREKFLLMINELDRANEIITDYMSLAKNKVIYTEAANLNDLVLDTLMPFVKEASKKRFEIKLDHIPLVCIDTKEIKQLILNLVYNGLDVTPEGGFISIRTFTYEDEVILVIKDQGNGIPDGLINKIGTPFFTTKETGAGLGLAVCYSIAERHKATIDIKTSQSGTTIYVRFRLRNF